MNNRLLANGIAKAIAEGETPEAIAKALNIDLTTVLNMADNAKSRDYTEVDNMKTHSRIEYQSDILKNSFIYAIESAGRSYLKKKFAALRAKGNYQEEAIKEAQEHRAQFGALVQYAPIDWTPENVVLEFCGMGREWNATGKAVQQFAEANQIDAQTAADLVSQQMIVAQDYAQATRGQQFGVYLGWLHQVIQTAEEEGFPEPANLEKIVQDAYKRAAQWNLPQDGILIREFAGELGISDCLPSWAENLKANMPTPEQAAAARLRMAQRSAQQSARDAEAEDELRRRHGEF